MVLDVLPLHEEGRNCIIDAIVTSAVYLKNECDLVFSEAWNFTLLTEDPLGKGLLGTRIYSEWGDIINLFEKYYGLKIKKYNGKAPIEVLEVIKKELHINHPVIITTDAYYCPWHNDYNRHHRIHTCLVTGFEKNALYCIDAQPINRGSILPMEDFINGIHGYSIFSISNNDIKEIDYKDLIAGSVCSSNGFDDMRRLSKILVDKLNLNQECQGYPNLWEVPLFINLQKVAGGRLHYAKFLQRLSVNYNIDNLQTLANQLLAIGSSWSKVRTMLIKCSMMPEKKAIIKKIADIIKENADVEEKVSCKLSGIAKDTSEPTISGLSYEYYDVIEPYSTKIPEFIYLDLKEYFNNNAFGSDTISESNKADLSGTGYFILNKGLPSNSLWEVENMKFKFPSLKMSVNDNLSCTGQLINAYCSECRSIMLLGTSEWGSFKEDIIIYFTNGDTEIAPLDFSEWTYLPKYGEKVAWVGEGAYRVDNSIKILSEQIRIFARIYYLKRTGIIESIKLPDSLGMHLFAISLGK